MSKKQKAKVASELKAKNSENSNEYMSMEDFGTMNENSSNLSNSFISSTTAPPPPQPSANTTPPQVATSKSNTHLKPVVYQPNLNEFNTSYHSKMSQSSVQSIPQQQTILDPMSNRDTTFQTATSSSSHSSINSNQSIHYHSKNVVHDSYNTAYLIDNNNQMATQILPYDNYTNAASSASSVTLNPTTNTNNPTTTNNPSYSQSNYFAYKNKTGFSDQFIAQDTNNSNCKPPPIYYVYLIKYLL